MMFEEIESVDAPSDGSFYGGIAAGTAIGGLGMVALIGVALLFTS